MERKPSLESQILRSDMKRMWLCYFNNTLLAEGLLTPEEHRKMQVRIANAYRGGKTSERK